MTVTAASFKANRPEFSAIPDGRVGAFITYAQARHRAAAWQWSNDSGDTVDLYDLVIELETAHQLTRSPSVSVAPVGGIAGSITQIKGEEQSVSFSSGPSGAVGYQTTAYGQELLELFNLQITPSVANDPTNYPDVYAPGFYPGIGRGY